MSHQSKIVPGSIEHTSVHGVAFVLRCCDDKATDHSVHLQDAGLLDEQGLKLKMQQALDQHASMHAQSHAARTHIESLISENPPDIEDCEDCK